MKVLNSFVTLLMMFFLVVGCSKRDADNSSVSDMKQEFNQLYPQPALSNSTTSSSDCYTKYLDSVRTFTKAVAYYKSENWSSYGTKLEAYNNQFDQCALNAVIGNPAYEEKAIGIYNANENIQYTGNHPIILIPNDTSQIRSYLNNVNNAWSTYAPNMLSRLTDIVNAVWDDNNNYTYFYTWYTPAELLNLFINEAVQEGQQSYLYSINSATNHHLWVKGFLTSVALKIAIPYDIAKDYFVRPNNPPIFYDIEEEPADGDPMPDTYYEIWNGIFVLIES